MHMPSQDNIWEFDIFCFARFFFIVHEHSVAG
jgi:hypothetical protein